MENQSLTGVPLPRSLLSGLKNFGFLDPGVITTSLYDQCPDGAL